MINQVNGRKTLELFFRFPYMDILDSWGPRVRSWCSSYALVNPFTSGVRTCSGDFSQIIRILFEKLLMSNFWSNFSFLIAASKCPFRRRMRSFQV